MPPVDRMSPVLKKEARGQGPHADPEGGKGKETDSSRVSWKNEVLLSPLFHTSETLFYVQPSVFLFFAFFFNPAIL